MLFNAGDHTPVIPLFDVVERELKVLPLQIGLTCVNVGVVLELTTTVSDAVSAHGPAGSGVNTYVVVVVLFNEGDQVPLKPLLEVVGSGLKAPPLQIGAIKLNVGSGNDGVEKFILTSPRAPLPPIFVRCVF